MLSALLAVAGVALGVTYVFVDQVWIGVAALACCVLGLVPHVVPLVVHRRTSSDDGPGHSPDAAIATPAPVPEVAEESAAAPAKRIVATAAEAIPTTVVVLPGRKRFHRADCVLVVDKDVEELTFDDAVEEGFTACSRCR
ncbi:MAG: hypothetical protein QOH68_790 [Nocardioidaceae bacterium]|jgi:hypothetical protein|nr:hypothetical protein [Nocardioidaceae bacterium]